MHSINSKLTLAFLFTSLVSVVFATMLISWQTSSQFSEFVSSSDKDRISDELGEYYEHNGWAEVDEYIETNNFLKPIHDQIIVLDRNRKVVFSDIGGYSKGQVIDLDNEKDVSAITDDGSTLGYILFSFEDSGFSEFSLESEFVNQVGVAVIVSGGVAVVIAFAIGGVLARTFSQPIQEFTKVTKELADGALGKHVQVRSKDEIGELATAFNQMSENLERAVKYREQVTADIAHDLRTPLTILGTYTEGLIDGTLENNKETFALMQEEVVYLQRLVTDLRTLSLVDAGELAINRSKVSPKALLERVGLTYVVEAEKKGVSLRVAAEDDLPQVALDVDRVTQVLVNIVSNAITYTESGEIVLSAQVDAQHVFFTIQDTGVGIDPEHLPYIFDRFYRGDKSRQRSGDGTTGLGLAISKAIVEAHGGEIRVESKLEGGSKFMIKLIKR